MFTVRGTSQPSLSVVPVDFRHAHRACLESVFVLFEL